MNPRIEIIILNSNDKLFFINIKEQKLNFGYLLVLMFEHHLILLAIFIFKKQLFENISQNVFNPDLKFLILIRL
jgi:hypothetical protein